MKNWKLLLVGLLTFIASVLGGGYSGSVTAEKTAAKADALPVESYGTAYSDNINYKGARFVAVYDVDVYWSTVVTLKPPGLPAYEHPDIHLGRHTVEIADQITDDKVAAALQGKAPFQNSTFLMVLNHKLIRYTKREADAGGKTKYEPEVK